jgi:hypothetical protein
MPLKNPEDRRPRRPADRPPPPITGGRFRSHGRRHDEERMTTELLTEPQDVMEQEQEAGAPAAAAPGAPGPVTAMREGEFFPAALETREETGIPATLLTALVYKYLLARGESTGRGCAGAICMPPKPVIETLTELKNKRHAVYAGTSSMGDFNYTLTEEGREVAKRYMTESMYVGPAPVTLETYVQSVAAQSITTEKPRREHLDEAFSDLLVNDRMFDRLGPAINSGKGMLLFGFPGNGKTSIAERITRCFGTTIWIPHSIFVEGAIVKFFDPEVHEPVEHKVSLLKGGAPDPRWIRIKRPTIIVGGELTMSALELSYNDVSKISSPSLQLRSNCGTLVIDDFGRQRMNPAELLNRWIVPLEKRFDYLTLSNGKKIRVPFDQLIIFSTNLEPKDLVDDAFLRRIPYKICVEDPSEAEFRQIMQIMAEKLAIAWNDDAVNHLIDTWYKSRHRPFRACQPRDLLLQILNTASYLGVEPQMTRDLFDKAADCYFSAVG